MSALKQPMGQKLLTNVSVVRLRKGGSKFEIATYPNMVLAWRNGVEKDVGEVLQIDRVYKDVEKGEYAKTKDLDKLFGTSDQEQICLEILSKGEIQLSEKERGAQSEALMKEVCTIVADKCINSQSKRPVTVGVVERALAELHFTPLLNQPAKKQALEAIKMLEGKYPIERAPMGLKLTFPSKAQAAVQQKIAGIALKVEKEEDKNGKYTGVNSACKLIAEIVCFQISAVVPTHQPLSCGFTPFPHEPLCAVVLNIHPEKYRECDALVREYKEQAASLEVLQLTVQGQGDASVDDSSLSSPTKSAVSVPKPDPTSSAERKPVDSGSEGFKSSTAPGMVFASREELTTHMKSDWHKHNLKLKSEGKPLMNKEQFLEFQILSGEDFSGMSKGSGEQSSGRGSKSKGKKNKHDLWD